MTLGFKLYALSYMKVICRDAWKMNVYSICILKCVIKLHLSSPAVLGTFTADRWLLCTGLLPIMSPEHLPADLDNVVTLGLNHSLDLVSTK